MVTYNSLLLHICFTCLVHLSSVVELEMWCAKGSDVYYRTNRCERREERERETSDFSHTRGNACERKMKKKKKERKEKEWMNWTHPKSDWQSFRLPFSLVFFSLYFFFCLLLAAVALFFDEFSVSRTPCSRSSSSLVDPVCPQFPQRVDTKCIEREREGERWSQWRPTPLQNHSHPLRFFSPTSASLTCLVFLSSSLAPPLSLQDEFILKKQEMHLLTGKNWYPLFSYSTCPCLFMVHFAPSLSYPRFPPSQSVAFLCSPCVSLFSCSSSSQTVLCWRTRVGHRETGRERERSKEHLKMNMSREERRGEWRGEEGGRRATVHSCEDDFSSPSPFPTSSLPLISSHSQHFFSLFSSG